MRKRKAITLNIYPIDPEQARHLLIPRVRAKAIYHIVIELITALGADA